MQSLQGLQPSDFEAIAKQPVSKLELYIDGNWIELKDGNGKSFVIEARYSSGIREISLRPVSAELWAKIDDTSGDFNPKNSQGAYKDYLKIGRRVRFSTGFKKDGTDYFWQWFIGVIDSINIDRRDRSVSIHAFDFTQYLHEVELKSPNNYWGGSVTKSTVAGQLDYEMPGDCKGAYIAYYNGDPIYDGDTWVYDKWTNKFWFLPSKAPGNGSNNLIIYYYKSTAPENIIADLLVVAGLYSSRSAALSDMDYTATGILIDRARFDAGTSAFNAIQMVCERCNYTFYFKYNGKPVFKPLPSQGSSVFNFGQELLSSVSYLENIDEVRNHIIIEGEEYLLYEELYRILSGDEIMYTLDDIPDGENYGRVALTSISAGKIIIAGLDAEVTDRMFTDPQAKENIEAWRHTNDVTMIDGGKIYTGSVLANSFETAVTTDNMVLNPSFEHSGSWDYVAGSGTASRTTDDKTEGSYSLYIPNGLAWGCRAIPLVPGDYYTVRVKVRGTTQTSQGLYIRMEEKSTYPTGRYVTGANRDSYTNFINNGPVPSSWTTYEFTYQVPAGRYWGTLSISNWTGGPTGVYVDEAEVRKQLGAVHIENSQITTPKLAAGAVTAEKLAAGAVTTGKLDAGAVTAEKISVSSLSAISANMGTLTAGKIDVGNIEINADTERILMGQASGPMTGTGVFIGKDGNDYELRAGNPSGHCIHWDGQDLTIYRSGSVYMHIGYVIAGVTRAMKYIDEEGIYFGQIIENQTAYRYGDYKYEIKAFSQGGGIYYLGFNTSYQGGGGGSGDEPPHGDPQPQ